ncbi:VOC family protein [Nonomuraea soli]|uniref:Putative enzyme related to lactoylglutathione lyase n=1 Tax=Nonomuraea soli TaxID=1032476 RepID=A0A7W0CRY3_9ACTN|nr:VOC family protein [Nonomuraea soli]MBA2896177.1 putative enzyme related to lactoylglutathione lyase [Nonomuraea soli]
MNTISALVIDCAAPDRLVTFYQKVLGGEVSSDPDFSSLNTGRMSLSFQRVDGYEPPAWPGGGKHAHLDLAVDDVQAAVDELVSLGASRPEHQPGGDGWVVLRDPEGHLFCVAQNS